MHRHLVRPTLAIAVAALAGCSYLQNRANDLFDVFTIDGAIGPGLYAEVRATDLVAVGLGYHESETAGLHGRFVGRGGSASGALGPLILGTSNSLFDAAPLLPDDPSEYDSSTEAPGMQILVAPEMGIKCGGGYSVADRGLHLADVGFTASLGYVGMHVGFSPGELLDLVCGLFGLDISEDDSFPVAPPAKATEAKEGERPSSPVPGGR